MEKPLFEEGMRILELGPDGCPSTFQSAVARKSIKWETLDISNANEPTYLAEEYKFPVPDNQFDIVLSGRCWNMCAKYGCGSRRLHAYAKRAAKLSRSVR